MTPSQTIQHEALKPEIIVDTTGRRLLVRNLTALDTLRLFKAAGPILAQNEPWLSMAGLAFSVLEIDSVPVPAPLTEVQIENLVDRLGDVGLLAVANALKIRADIPDPKSQVGNLPGTLS